MVDKVFDDFVVVVGKRDFVGCVVCERIYQNQHQMVDKVLDY